MLTPLPLPTVTVAEIIASLGTIVTCASGLGLMMLRIGKVLGSAATEFRTGIASLTEALNKLSGSVDSGFTAVHERLDKGETKMTKMDKRILRVELNSGIDPDIS